MKNELPISVFSLSYNIERYFWYKSFSYNDYVKLNRWPTELREKDDITNEFTEELYELIKKNNKFLVALIGHFFFLGIIL